MTDRELDLYAEWESERMRYAAQAQNARDKNRSALADKYEALERITFKHMRAICREQ